MIRILFSLILLVALIYAATWFADVPGAVTIDWWGLRIETSFSFLVAAVALLAVLCAIGYRLWRDLWHFPAHAAARWRDRRRRKGYQSLTKGLVALAAGDAREAERHARRAQSMRVDTPLTLLLSAQAAQLKGDDAAAAKFFKAMLDDPETSFLALRGLANEALRRGNKTEALGFIDRAREIRPKTAWVLTSLFDLQVRDKNWEKALDLLEELIKIKTLSKEEANHKRAVIYLAQSRAAIVRGEGSQALHLAQKAEKCDSGLVTATVNLARLLKKDGRIRRARNLIHKAWTMAPHPDLATVYGELAEGEDPLSRVRRFTRLSECNPGHGESHMALARASLDASLWGETRKHLGHVISRHPSRRAYLMMAELEEKGGKDEAASRNWLERAAEAEPDPVWVCSSCGQTFPEWRALCNNCHSFDGLVWRVPGGAFDVQSTAPVQAILSPP